MRRGRHAVGGERAGVDGVVLSGRGHSVNIRLTKQSFGPSWQGAGASWEDYARLLMQFSWVLRRRMKIEQSEAMFRNRSQNARRDRSERLTPDEEEKMLKEQKGKCKTYARRRTRSPATNGKGTGCHRTSYNSLASTPALVCARQSSAAGWYRILSLSRTAS